MTTETLTIDGMSCDHCVRAVADALDGLDGVEVDDVRVGAATIRRDEARTSRDAVAAALGEEGYALAS